MGYVIAAIAAVVIIGGFVTFLVLNATRKSNVSDAGDPGADQNPLGIIGSDDATPAGDTDQHAEPEHGERRFDRTTRESDVARPVVGGEAEGKRSSH